MDGSVTCIDDAELLKFVKELEGCHEDYRFSLCLSKESQLRKKRSALDINQEKIRQAMRKHCKEYERQKTFDKHIVVMEKAFPDRPGKGEAHIDCLRMLVTAETGWTLDRVVRYDWHRKSSNFCRQLNSAMINGTRWEGVLQKLNSIILARIKRMASEDIVTTTDFSNLADWLRSKQNTYTTSAQDIVTEKNISLVMLPNGYAFNNDGLITPKFHVSDDIPAVSRSLL